MVASVLSVAGGGPAQAANTAAEELKDTNADGVADSRWFAGGHRYQTAELLAGRFADLEGSVSSVIIANGVSQVDAVAAAGLAGSRNAAVLLTRPASLPHNVARFVSGRNVTNVTIVGGTAAVSAAVETALKGLASKPTVTRIMGANRFATAAMIGGELGGPNATWCGSNQRAAILVNGRDAGMSDAVVAGPLAYRLGLPVLLTEADELPAETRKFLVDNRVERVVVVGGTAAVSAGVINTLTEEVGVANAPRISGANAAATSVAVAKEMRGACKDELNVDPDRVALLSSTATADGIAAAPVLGRGLSSGGGSVPILLVDGSLPAEVRDFLATTPNTRAGNKTHMNVVAVGGKAVVTDAVMTAAVEAATTGGDLTAKISFKIDPAKPATSRQFTVTFSDDVRFTDDTTTAAYEPNVAEPNLYRINGRRLSAEGGNNPSESAQQVHSLSLAKPTVVVTLAQDIKTGDKLEVIGGAQVGANGDKRKLKGDSFIVKAPAAAADTAAPKVEVLATANSGNVQIIVSNPKLLKNSDGSLYVRDGGITITPVPKAQCKPSPCPRDGAALVGRQINERSFRQLTTNPNSARYIRPGTDGLGGVDGKGGGIFRLAFNVNDGTAGRKLQPGDVIEVKRGTFLGSGNRGNALVRHVVPAPTGNLTFSSISIGNRFTTASASAVLFAGTGVEQDISVIAKPTGIAAGAAGNGWRVFGYKLPTVDTNKAVDIDVDVDAKNKIISYTWRNGDAKLNHLVREFAANATFAANFKLDYTTRPGATELPELSGALTVSTTPVVLGEGTRGVRGKSAVAVHVLYNQNMQGGAAPLLAADLLGVPNIIIAPLQNRNWSSVWVANLFAQEARLPAPYDAVSIRTLFLGASWWISMESAELVAATKLPTRNGGPWFFRPRIGASLHANDPTTCGPFGVPKSTFPGSTCPSNLSDNQTAPDPYGRGGIVRSLRFDPSLRPFATSGTPVAEGPGTGR